MSRGIGELEAIREALPEALAVVVALVTQLGDVWFLAVVLAVVYWTHPDRREDAAVVVGLFLAGIGLLYATKYAFAYPRPVEPFVRVEEVSPGFRPLYELTGTAYGYGFPSGHALNSTIVYGSLAKLLTVGTRRRRFGAAAVLVTVVCASRVVLGVHFLVDVVAGVALGIAFLLAAWHLLAQYPGDRPTVVFVLAIAVSALNLAIGNDHLNAVRLVGASLGAFAGWQVVVLHRQRTGGESPASSRRFTARAMAAVVVLALLFVGVLAPLDPTASTTQAGSAGLVVAAFLALSAVHQTLYEHRGATGHDVGDR